MFCRRGGGCDFSSPPHQAACLAWSKAADEALLSLMRYARPLSVCSETRLTEFPADDTGEKAAHRMLLPIRGSHDRSDCCARWRPQHCNDAGVLGLVPRWRLRRREHRLPAGFGLAGLSGGYARRSLSLVVGL